MYGQNNVDVNADLDDNNTYQWWNLNSYNSTTSDTQVHPIQILWWWRWGHNTFGDGDDSNDDDDRKTCYDDDMNSHQQ